MIIKMHPKYALLRRLSEGAAETDVEVGLTKLRYEAAKIEERKKLDNVEYEVGNGKRRKIEYSEMSENELELQEAKERQVFNPLDRTFNFSKKRATDMPENAKIFLPKAAKPEIETELNMMKGVIMKGLNQIPYIISRLNMLVLDLIS